MTAARLPVVVCANLVINQDTLLLVRESKPSALQRWSLPAGKLEPGETLRHGAEREALEEAGVTVAAGPLVGIYHCLDTLEGGSAINFVFRSTVIEGEIVTTAAHPEVGFVPFTEVERLLLSNMIRGSHVKLALAAAIAGRELPEDLVSVVPACGATEYRRARCH